MLIVMIFFFLCTTNKGTNRTTTNYFCIFKLSTARPAQVKDRFLWSDCTPDDTLRETDLINALSILTNSEPKDF